MAMVERMICPECRANLTRPFLGHLRDKHGWTDPQIDDFLIALGEWPKRVER